MDDLQEKYDEINWEVKALRGKELFRKNAYNLCLVANVKIPHKFKVPDFEKYKGNICPKSHLVMYARKMSTQTDNHHLCNTHNVAFDIPLVGYERFPPVGMGTIRKDDPTLIRGTESHRNERNPEAV
jgi:hypothetical protein